MTARRKTTSATQGLAKCERRTSDFAARYISKAEVAARLGKTSRTVEQWMASGVIPYIKIGKGRRATVLFKWADIEAHLKSNFGVGFNCEHELSALPER